MQLLRRGQVGPAVARLRSTLSALGLLPAKNGQSSPDEFDPTVEHAVRAFQQQRGLITDGVVGPATDRALRDATYRLGARPLAWTVSAPVTGDDVSALQVRLLELGYDVGRPNGVFEHSTDRALRRFQRECGLTVDGICGPETVRALRRLAPRTSGGRPLYLREQERMRSAGPRLTGKRIVLDPGHGGADPGVTARNVHESDLMWDLVRRLEGRMLATGMEALLTRGYDVCPSEPERARFANEAGADLFLSLHSDGNSSLFAQGVASFHYGTGNGATSTIGETLAGYLQRELAVRTGLRDCRSHPKTWDCLRLTRCPAVRIEIGYLTNEWDRDRLADPGFRDIVAEGILVAVKRMYLFGKNDQPTGTFTFADVLRQEFVRAEY